MNLIIIIIIIRHTNAVVVQWLMLEASIALFARRHPARQSDTML